MKWADTKEGYGEHYFEYNHGPQHKKHHDDGYKHDSHHGFDDHKEHHGFSDHKGHHGGYKSHW